MTLSRERPASMKTMFTQGCMCQLRLFCTTVKAVVQVEVLGGESAGVALTLLRGCSAGLCKREKGLPACSPQGCMCQLRLLCTTVKAVVQVEVFFLGGDSAGVAMTLLIGCSVGECKLEKGLKA